MGIKFKNDAKGTLATGITDVQTTIALSIGQGAKFPDYPNTNDYSLVTLQSTTVPGKKEIVKLTAKAGDVLTVERGHSSDYPAQAFMAGDFVLIGFPAEALAALNEYDSAPAAGTASGKKIYLTAGEHIEFGEVAYMSAPFKARKADADAFETLPGFYMCVEPAGLDAEQKGNFLKEGIVAKDGWNWTGGPVFLSLNTGELTQTAPDADGQQVQPIGIALASNVIDFDPSLITIETKTAV